MNHFNEDLPTVKPSLQELLERSHRLTAEGRAHWKEVKELYRQSELLQTMGSELKVCQVCDGMGAVTKPLPMGHPEFGKSFPCVCQREQVINRVFDGSSIPTRYKRLTFETFEALPDELKEGKTSALEFCRLLAENNRVIVEGIELPGLLLSGNCGLGKTGLASATIQEIASSGKITLWIDYTAFLRKVQATYANHDGPSSDEVISSASKIPFLLLDDMGDMERGSQPISDDQRRITYQLISTRHAAMLPTLITTNLSIAQFYSQFGNRISDRVFELCHHVQLSGLNLRFGA